MILKSVIKTKTLLVRLFFPMLFFAQLNESTALKIQGQLSLTGFWQSGNVQIVIFSARVEGSMEAIKTSFSRQEIHNVYQEFR